MNTEKRSGRDMDHEEKIKWMIDWCNKNNLRLELNGEVGFGRECVGVIAYNGCYPDYEWYDEETWDRLDKNGDVWIPPDAYHKHPCVAVLGRGEKAEAQLYEWLKWFDENNFKLEVGVLHRNRPFYPIELLIGKHFYARMVRVKS